jgi:regulatory protein
MAGTDGGTQEEALRRAFKFLTYRSRSEAEVRAKLSHWGFSRQRIESTLDKLRSLNLLNDETFARSWAQGRVEGRGYGPLRIERELRQKRIAPPLILQILRETFDETQGRERARALLEKRFRGKDLEDKKILQRAVAFLQRRGYRDSVIAEVLKMPVED